MVEIVFTSAIHDTSLKFKVVFHSLLYICPINREYMTRAVLPSIYVSVYYLEIIIICSSIPLSGMRTLHIPVSLSQLHSIDSVSFSKFSSNRSGFTYFIFFPLAVTSFGAFAE